MSGFLRASDRDPRFRGPHLRPLVERRSTSGVGGADHAHGPRRCGALLGARRAPHQDPSWRRFAV